MLRRLLLTLLALGAIMAPLHLVGLAHAARQDAGPLVIYCGRGKSLVEPLLERFERQTGIESEIRYAGSTDLANLLLEEGRRTPADVFFSQDPGALGAVGERGLLATLPPTTLSNVQERYRADDGRWVGTSGRARVIAWSTDRLTQEDVPPSVFDLTDPAYRGRVGWAPANASFQLFVTAMRHRHGEERTREWLEAMKANDVRDYPKNRPVIAAIADGEIDFGLVNHYYLRGFKRDRGEDFPVANAFLADDVGGMMSSPRRIGGPPRSSSSSSCSRRSRSATSPTRSASSRSPETSKRPGCRSAPGRLLSRWISEPSRIARRRSGCSARPTSCRKATPVRRARCGRRLQRRSGENARRCRRSGASG